eukprot:gene7678-8485_t
MISCILSFLPFLSLFLLFSHSINAFVIPKSDFLLEIDGNSVSTARGRVCALEQQPGVEVGGRARCWSRRDEDEEEESLPEAVYVQVVVGATFVCGLTIDGAVNCRGAAAIPSQLQGYFKQITADSRGRFLCGLRTDGSILCYGSSKLLANVPTAGGFVQITCSSDHCCALTDKDYVSPVTQPPTLTYQEFLESKRNYDWIIKRESEEEEEEDVEEEELDEAQRAERLNKQEIQLMQFRQLSAADAITCGITLFGSHLLCWGAKHIFRKGFPRRVMGPYRQVSAGMLGVCVITGDHIDEQEGDRSDEESSARSASDRLVCWGNVKDMVRPAQFDGWDQVSVGSTGACAVSLDSDLACWGHTFPDTLYSDLSNFVVA